MENKETHWGLVSQYRQEIMGFACLWVIASHNIFDWPGGSDIIYTVRRLFDYGNAGVELFLLVSGIGLCYAYPKRKSLMDFYLRRYVRLLIPYLLISVPYLVWRDLYIGDGNFLMDVFQLSFPMEGFVSFWYIPASAVFYLIFPVIYYWQNTENALGLRLTREMKTLLICLALFVCLLIVMKVFPEFYGNCEIALTRIIIFIIGCHLGIHTQRKTKIPGHWVVAGAAFFVGLLQFREMVSVQGFWYRMVYVPFGLAVIVVLAWLLNRKYTGGIRAVLRFCGNRSIELYLSHIVFRNLYWHYFGDGIFGGRRVWDYGLIIGISFVASVALHPVIEKISRLLLRKTEK